MPALGIKPEFVRLILDGTKCMTIRAHRKDRRLPAKRGDHLKLYTGMRTKNCRHVATVEVVAMTYIEIDADNYRQWAIYPNYDSDFDKDTYKSGLLQPPMSLSTRDVDEFARDDGFQNWEELVAFFRKTHGLPFNGILIVWNLLEVPA